MFEAIKPLIDSGLLNEDAKNQIQEAWEQKLTEAKQEMATEMRAEFANRYEHDKNKMVQALDQMVTENLSRELNEFAEEKEQFIKFKAKAVAEMQAKAKAVDKFIAESLRNEIAELKADRKTYNESLAKLDSFVSEGLTRELNEFAEDKADLARTKVKLVSEAKSRFNELKKDFVERSSVAVREAVSSKLESEMRQLKEDIQVARENNFGRRLFEAFASEFSSSHLNENVELRNLKKALAGVEKELNESQVALVEKTQLVESREKEIKRINESVSREKVISGLLKPLSNEKAAVMTDLLESVQTERLKSAFDKYLPAVMDGSTKGKKTLNESVTVKTGDRKAKQPVDSTENKGDNIVELKRLAGL